MIPRWAARWSLPARQAAPPRSSCPRGPSPSPRTDIHTGFHHFCSPRICVWRSRSHPGSVPKRKYRSRLQLPVAGGYHHPLYRQRRGWSGHKHAGVPLLGYCHRYTERRSHQLLAYLNLLAISSARQGGGGDLPLILRDEQAAAVQKGKRLTLNWARSGQMVGGYL